MTDKDIIQKFQNYKNGRFKLTIEEKEYLLNRYKNSTGLSESIFRILHHIEEKPKCPYCNNYIKFFKFGYGFFKTCNSEECKKKYKLEHSSFNNPETQKHCKETMLKRYGVPNPYNIERVKKNCKEKSFTKEAIEKRKKTNIEKYGVDNPFKSKEIQNRIYKTHLKIYGKDCYAEGGIIKERIKKTIKEKYGVEYATQSKQFIDKAFETRKLHHTTKYSMEENYAFLYLSEQYPDIIRQYTSKEYPWHCDFYIPCLDLYIECNFYWSHGAHPFNPNSNEDLKELEKLKTKNYVRQIKTWTQSDVQKRETAKRNHLNYKEFYSLEEVIEWLK